MPRKKCPNNIYVTKSQKSVLEHIIHKILIDLSFYGKGENTLLQGNDKIKLFNVCLRSDQIPALEEFYGKMQLL